MSGYLQRLVSTVARPDQAVHPRIGSIYTPQSLKRESPLPEPEEIEVLASARSFEPVRDTQRAEINQRSEYDVPVPPPLLPKQAPEPGGEPRAVVGPRNPGTPTEPSAARQNGEAEPDRGDRLVGLQPREPETDSESAPAERAYRPLILPSRVPEPRAAAPAARPEQGQSRRAVTTQPDEIQVHIGRIEITAVPAPVQQQVAKAPDKSISLDAYLSRRNGRGR